MYLIGGQSFGSLPNPIYPGGCAFLPQGVPCLPIVPNSQFFDDVWSSKDAVTWTPETMGAPWEGRAGLSAVVHNGAIHIFGGSALFPHFFVEREFESGKLVQAITDYPPPELSINAVYETRRHLLPKLQAFLGFLKEQFGTKA